ncbi:MAG: hypothetical protein ACREBS_07885 [Nitrososphaerales archaeon]
MVTEFRIGLSQVKDLRDGVMAVTSTQSVRRLQSFFQANGPVPEDLLTEIGDSLGVTDYANLKLYRTWNDLTLDLAMLFQAMTSESYIASRYFDFRISEACLRAAARGCKFNTLHSSRVGSSTTLQIYGNLASNPKALRVFKQVLKNPDMTIKEADFPYSFVVIDSRTVTAEIINPEDPNTFFFGLRLDSAELASKLIDYYREIARNGIEDKRQKLLATNSSATRKDIFSV